MTDLIERVEHATSGWVIRYNQWTLHTDIFHHAAFVASDPFTHVAYIRLKQLRAIAAIKAMRDPTDEMRAAVAENWGRRTWAEFGKVIDAALGEAK